MQWGDELAEGPWGVLKVGITDDYRIVDVQDVSVATVWCQPEDPLRWARNAAVLMAAAPQMHGALTEAYTALIRYQEMSGVSEYPEDEDLRDAYIAVEVALNHVLALVVELNEQ